MRPGVVELPDAIPAADGSILLSPDVNIPNLPQWALGPDVKKMKKCKNVQLPLISSLALLLSTQGNPRVSGWDIKNIYFQFDLRTGDFHIGINCFGICGDADGDLDPNRSSPELVSVGGLDTADFMSSELFAIALDLGSPDGNAPDGKMDFIIGYPPERSVGSDICKSCG